MWLISVAWNKRCYVIDSDHDACGPLHTNWMWKKTSLIRMKWTWHGVVWWTISRVRVECVHVHLSSDTWFPICIRHSNGFSVLKLMHFKPYFSQTRSIQIIIIIFFTMLSCSIHLAHTSQCCCCFFWALIRYVCAHEGLFHLHSARYGCAFMHFYGYKQRLSSCANEVHMNFIQILCLTNTEYAFLWPN